MTTTGPTNELPETDVVFCRIARTGSTKLSACGSTRTMLAMAVAPPHKGGTLQPVGNVAVEPKPIGKHKLVCITHPPLVEQRTTFDDFAHGGPAEYGALACEQPSAVGDLGDKAAFELAAVKENCLLREPKCGRLRSN